MARAPSIFSRSGVCNVAMNEQTNNSAVPGFVLGQPFLRSTYVYVLPHSHITLSSLIFVFNHRAYRFPTNDCPGYYGFAFPSGANRTESQKAQRPATTPSNSAECLNIVPPTSTPSPLAVAKIRKEVVSGFSVYGNEADGQVSLAGVNELPAVPKNRRTGN